MAAANFKGVAEKFRMSLLDGQNPERIQVEVSISAGTTNFLFGAPLPFSVISWPPVTLHLNA
jgi:hypothetical protein